MPMQSLPPMIIICAAFTVIPLGMKATDWAFGKVRRIAFVLCVNKQLRQNAGLG